MVRAEFLPLRRQLFCDFRLRRRLRHIFIVDEIVDARPIFVGADPLILAVSIEVNRIVADVIEHAVHDQPHIALAHLRYQRAERVHVAEQRIEIAVIDRIIPMIGAGIHYRIDIDRGDPQVFKVIQLLCDAREIAAEEIIALPFVVLFGRFAVIRRQIVPSPMLNGLMSARRLSRLVIALVAVEKSVGENLIDDRLFRPVRRMIIGAVHRQLIRLRRLRIVAVLFYVVEQKFIAVNAVALRIERHRPQIAIALRPRQLHSIGLNVAFRKIGIVLVAALGSDFRLVKDQLRVLNVAALSRNRQRDRLADFHRLKRHPIIAAPRVVENFILVNPPVINNQSMLRAVVVKRHLAALRDVDRLTQRRTAPLIDDDIIRAGFQIHVGLIKLIEHQIIHRDGAETAAELGQL